MGRSQVLSKVLEGEKLSAMLFMPVLVALAHQERQVNFIRRPGFSEEPVHRHMRPTDEQFDDISQEDWAKGETGGSGASLLACTCCGSPWANSKPPASSPHSNEISLSPYPSSNKSSIVDSSVCSIKLVLYCMQPTIHRFSDSGFMESVPGKAVTRNYSRVTSGLTLSILKVYSEFTRSLPEPGVKSSG